MTPKEVIVKARSLQKPESAFVSIAGLDVTVRPSIQHDRPARTDSAVTVRPGYPTN